MDLLHQVDIWRVLVRFHYLFSVLRLLLLIDDDLIIFYFNKLHQQKKQQQTCSSLITAHCSYQTLQLHEETWLRKSRQSI